MCHAVFGGVYLHQAGFGQHLLRIFGALECLFADSDTNELVNIDDLLLLIGTCALGRLHDVTLVCASSGTEAGFLRLCNFGHAPRNLRAHHAVNPRWAMAGHASSTTMG